jgi:hypothetical protein
MNFFDAAKQTARNLRHHAENNKVIASIVAGIMAIAFILDPVGMALNLIVGLLIATLFNMTLTWSSKLVQPS